MEGKRYLIGVDPSIKTAGVCLYDTLKKTMSLYSGDIFECIDFIRRTGKLAESVAVIENANLDKAVFRGIQPIRARINAMKERRPGATIESIMENVLSFGMQAQGVGKSKAASDVFILAFKKSGVPVVEVAPSKRDRADKANLKKLGVRMLVMPTKTTAAQFQEITGYQGRCNEDARDAAMLVWDKNMRWA